MPEPALSPVSFRLPSAFASELLEQAKENDMSQGSYARQLVMNALNDTDSDRIEHAISQLRAEYQQLRADLDRQIETLRSDFATAVSALLSDAGKVTRESARTWAKKNLFP